MIYERIKKLCSARGISIYELEKTLGFTRGHLYKWKESSPTTEKIKLVADYFGVTIDYLVSEERNFADEPVKEGALENKNTV